MAQQSMARPATTGYAPTEEDLAGLAAWFERYDALSETADTEAMADMGAFPMNLVTDGSDGDAYTAQWDRAQYLATMSGVMGDGSPDVAFSSVRTPHFLSPRLVVVFSRATMTYGDQTQDMDYADVLVRIGGEWRFQTMVQAGWADMMRGGGTG